MKFITLALVPVFFLSSCTTSNPDRINAEISALSEKYAPDHRTEICTIYAGKGPSGTVLLKGETTVPSIRNELISTLSNDGIALVDSILVLPDTTLPFRGLATLSVINLRKTPDHAAELVSQVIMSTPLQILKKDGYWYFVRTPDQYLAWVEKPSVKILNTEEFEQWRNSSRTVYLKSTGWIYSDAECSGVVSDIVAGSICTEAGRREGLINISLPDGRSGYIHKEDAMNLSEFRELPQDNNKIIETACSLMGIPYLWGGSSSKGADCSGFVQTVFFQNGLILQRDASMQAKHGIPIDISNDFTKLLPADLLFFGSPEHITHVAIYKGGGEYIHSSGRVMINSLYPDSSNYIEFRRNSLVKAMRILGSEDAGIVTLKYHPWY
jgi:hypothetical protein